MCKRSMFPRFLFPVFAALACLPAAALAYDGELLLFPSVFSLHRTDPAAAVKHNTEAELDTFYTASHERMRLLAEYMLSRDEKSMERLQLGWLPTSSSRLWLGRFHNPLGYWNTEFHHGSYLMTTFSRPSILAFEDMGQGVLPIHINGLLLEGTSDPALSYALGLGLGPNLGVMGLTPIDILQPTKEDGRLALSGRLTYHPKADSKDEYSVFAARTRIPAKNLPVTRVTQSLAGAALNNEAGELRLIGEVYAVNNRIDSAGSHTFTSGYVQADYSIQSDWTLFGRVERTTNASNDAYLNYIPLFITARTLAGARYALGHNQAVKLELSHNDRQDKVHFNQASIEWCAVFP